MNTRINYILSMISVCIVGLIFTQGFWLYKDYKYYSSQPLFSNNFDYVMPVSAVAATRMDLVMDRTFLPSKLQPNIDIEKGKSILVYPKGYLQVGAIAATGPAAPFMPNASANVITKLDNTLSYLENDLSISSPSVTAPMQTSLPVETSNPINITARYPEEFLNAHDIAPSAITAAAVPASPSGITTEFGSITGRYYEDFSNAGDIMPTAPFLPVGSSGITTRPGHFQMSAVLLKPPTSYIINKMKWQFGYSLLLILFTITCLSYMLVTIYKQRRLSKVKNEFIKNMAHELKTPLATVNVAVEGMKKFGALNDTNKTSQYLDISKNELSHLSDLIDQILEQSVFDSDHMQLNYKLIDVNDLLNKLVLSYSSTKGDIKILLHTDREEQQLMLDPVHISNAIRNLIDNAINYSLDHKTIHVNSKYEKENWVLSVVDNGIGIPKKYRKDIFNRFFRIKDERINVKGFGLGLCYVKQVIELHKGQVNLESTDTGSIFSLHLPLQKQVI